MNEQIAAPLASEIHDANLFLSENSAFGKAVANLKIRIQAKWRAAESVAERETYWVMDQTVDDLVAELRIMRDFGKADEARLARVPKLKLHGSRVERGLTDV